MTHHDTLRTQGARHVTVGEGEAGWRLERFLRAHVRGAPPALVHKWVRTGQVRVNGARAKAGAVLEAGQDVRIPPFAPPPPRGISDKDVAFARRLVIWEDAYALALAKPPGLVTQGGKGVARHLVDLLPALGEDVRLVHRLDRDTSGALLLAKSAAAATALAGAFKAQAVEKLYWAVVSPAPQDEAATIVAPLEKGGGPGREKMRVTKGGQRARTDFRVLTRIGTAAALVAFAPRTGRTHQIRAHAAHAGWPILGDGKYGGARALPGMEEAAPKTLVLHARRIRAPHPAGGGAIIDVSAPLPRATAALFHALGLETDPAWDALLPRR
ncbi:MAG: RluA family pseudouridine synthase [Alphaproteobacteria bacterium]|nr:RluA family pseudouridine synthase [Alphaproteobacteria bacterium]